HSACLSLLVSICANSGAPGGAGSDRGLPLRVRGRRDAIHAVRAVTDFHHSARRAAVECCDWCPARQASSPVGRADQAHTVSDPAGPHLVSSEILGGSAVTPAEPAVEAACSRLLRNIPMP